MSGEGEGTVTANTVVLLTSKEGVKEIRGSFKDYCDGAASFLRKYDHDRDGSGDDDDDDDDDEEANE